MQTFSASVKPAALAFSLYLMKWPVTGHCWIMNNDNWIWSVLHRRRRWYDFQWLYDTVYMMMMMMMMSPHTHTGTVCHFGWWREKVSTQRETDSASDKHSPCCQGHGVNKRFSRCVLYKTVCVCVRVWQRRRLKADHSVFHSPPIFYLFSAIGRHSLFHGRKLSPCQIRCWTDVTGQTASCCEHTPDTCVDHTQTRRPWPEALQRQATLGCASGSSPPGGAVL